MRKLLTWRRKLPALLALALLAANGAATAQGVKTSLPVETGAIQVIADVTAIQDRCWNLLVRPGIAFAYMETKGVRMIEVLPGGRLRTAFDRAFSDSNKIDADQLCGAIASVYARDLPGLIERR